MAVRDVAGGNKLGIPVTLESGTAKITHTCDVATIRGQITKSLADELSTCREQTQSASVQPPYRAVRRAYAEIDRSARRRRLPAGREQNVLQAARVNAVPTTTPRH